MFKKCSFYGALVAVVLSISLLSGCERPPTKEIENAEKALAEARQKEADQYVQDIFQKAESSMKKAKDLVTEKKYTEAKKAAEETVSLAQQTVPLVEPNKKKMKDEAEQLIKDIQGEIDDLKSLIAKAIKKKTQIKRDEIQGMIGKWEVDILSVRDLLQNQKVRQAHDQLISMQKQVKTQKEDITALLEAKTEKK